MVRTPLFCLILITIACDSLATGKIFEITNGTKKRITIHYLANQAGFGGGHKNLCESDTLKSLESLQLFIKAQSIIKIQLFGRNDFVKFKLPKASKPLMVAEKKGNIKICTIKTQSDYQFKTPDTLFLNDKYKCALVTTAAKTPSASPTQFDTESEDEDNGYETV